MYPPTHLTVPGSTTVPALQRLETYGDLIHWRLDRGATTPLLDSDSDSDTTAYVTKWSCKVPVSDYLDFSIPYDDFDPEALVRIAEAKLKEKGLWDKPLPAFIRDLLQCDLFENADLRTESAISNWFTRNFEPALDKLKELFASGVVAGEPPMHNRDRSWWAVGWAVAAAIEFQRKASLDATMTQQEFVNAQDYRTAQPPTENTPVVEKYGRAIMLKGAMHAQHPINSTHRPAPPPDLCATHLMVYSVDGVNIIRYIVVPHKGHTYRVALSSKLLTGWGFKLFGVLFGGMMDMIGPPLSPKMLEKIQKCVSDYLTKPPAARPTDNAMDKWPTPAVFNIGIITNARFMALVLESVLPADFGSPSTSPTSYGAPSLSDCGVFSVPSTNMSDKLDDVVDVVGSNDGGPNQLPVLHVRLKSQLHAGPIAVTRDGFIKDIDERVVVKTFHAGQRAFALDEARMITKARALCGDLVPAILGIFYHGNKDSKTHVVFKWCGMASKMFCDLSLKDKRLIKNVFEKLHEKGIYHGDVEPRNVVKDTATGKWTVVDFGEATTHICAGPTCSELDQLEKDLSF